MSFNGRNHEEATRLLLYFLLLIFPFFPGCKKEPANGSIHAREITLSGPITAKESQISGLDWYGEYLILLPQYPSFINKHRPVIFALKKHTIIDAVTNKNHSPLAPIEFRLRAPDMASLVPGYEGFEAIAFSQDTVYAAIEARPGPMTGYLIRGRADQASRTITLDPASLKQVHTPVNIPNAAYESIFIAGNEIAAVFEGNGKNINPFPRARIFNSSLTHAREIPFPTIEYRITDTTGLDTDSRFWAINYYWPGEEKEYRPGRDMLSGRADQPDLSRHIQRLVCFQYSPEGIYPTDTAPLYFTLPGTDTPHNWEGIARLENLGFLVITDRHPETVLAFVPYNN